MKLKERIKKWLYKDELEQMKLKISSLESEYDWLKNVTTNSVTMFNNAKRDCNDATETCKILQRTINDVCDVGVDVALYESYHNWAVVCIHGKTDFVKFIPMQQKDVRTIQQFLKQFEYTGNRMRIDSPLGYKDIIAPWLGKEQRH